MTKRVYATVQTTTGDTVRLAAELDSIGEMVLVYPAGQDYTFGWYRIERFENGRLTAGTLRKKFDGRVK